MMVTLLCLCGVFVLAAGVHSWVVAGIARTRLRLAGVPVFRPAHLGRIRRSRFADGPSVEALAALLDDVARRCASGEALAHAFASSREVAALSPLFDRTLITLQRGATFAEALQQQPVETPGVALVVHILTLCARLGGNVSEPLDRAAATLRERHAASQERIAQSAQARLSVRVLTLVPIGFASWTLLTSRDVQHFMLTPVGVICLSLGLALNVVGWRVMQRIVGGLR